MLRNSFEAFASRFVLLFVGTALFCSTSVSAQTVGRSESLAQSINSVNKILQDQGPLHIDSHGIGAPPSDPGLASNPNAGKEMQAVLQLDSQALRLSGCALTSTSIRSGAESKDIVNLYAFDPRQMKIETYAQYLHEYWLTYAFRKLSVAWKTDPPVYVVYVPMPLKADPTIVHNVIFGFVLDQAQAVQVTRAIIHASILCGGGQG